MIEAIRPGPAHCSCGHHALQHDLRATLLEDKPAACEVDRCTCRAYVLDESKTADVAAAMEAGFL